MSNFSSVAELPSPQITDTAEAPVPEPAHKPRRSMAQAIGLIATCTTAMLLNSANGTAVAIALPTLGRDMNIPAYRLQWVVSAYSLSSGCLLLFLGRLADLYGRKLTFLFGAFLMGVFGLGCGFANVQFTSGNAYRARLSAPCGASSVSWAGKSLVLGPLEIIDRWVHDSGLPSSDSAVEGTAGLHTTFFPVNPPKTRSNGSDDSMRGPSLCDKSHHGDEITLDVLRGFQGIGGAAVIPASLGMLAHAFPPSRIRSVAFAAFAAGNPVGAAVGSIIGGVLTQLTEKTWRSVFYFMTGISALVFVGGLLTFDKDMPSTEEDKRVDWLGAFLITAGLVMIVFVLSDGSIAPNGWKTGSNWPADIIALLVVGVLLMVAYVGWQYYLERVQDDPEAPRSWWTPPPLLRITLFGRGSGKLAAILAIAFLEYCGFMAFPFWLQLYYQDYIGWTHPDHGAASAHVRRGRALRRRRRASSWVLGTALTGVANLLFGVINPAATYWAFGFPATVLIVFGADFVFPSGTLFVARLCLPHEQSVGGALFQTLTQLGGSFGLAITTIVYNAVLKSMSLRDGVAININGTNAPPDAQLHAYKDAFFTAAAFNFFAAILAIVFLRTVGAVGDRGDGSEPTEAEEKAPVSIEAK
ncbi:major facilitator superfamily domain-containing protein [Sparassis latifolia]